MGPPIAHGSALTLLAELRDMRKKADNEKKEEALAAATMSSIEARARKQYEQDLKESSKAREDLTGTWVSRYTTVAPEFASAVPHGLLSGIVQILFFGFI